MLNKTLYGLTKTNKTKYWNIRTIGNRIIVSHGQLGGKLQVKEEVVAGKNIGRANATSPEEQAAREAESKYRKQMDRGYRPTQEELNSLPILPMLAKDYRNDAHRIAFPCYISAKLDGVRCLAFWQNDRVILLSRLGKEYEVLHIKRWLERTLPKDVMLDGELYIHNLDLEDIISAVKKPNENTLRIEFVVFDVASPYDFSTRLTQMESLRKILTGGGVKLLCYDKVESESDIKKLHRFFVQQGYEGVMLRNLHGMYESGKRSADLQKYKEFLDEEFIITDIFEDRNGNAVFELYCPMANDTFTCTYGDFEQRKEFLQNKSNYINQHLTIKYQKRYRKTLKPQFPVGVTIRNYE